jgi:4-amino-4-deoxy-L-arabinose transferase-like glycosyltransferase
MDRQTFAGGGAKNRLRWGENWTEVCLVLGLFLVALALFGANLGSLPLQTVEGAIAETVNQIWQDENGWLAWWQLGREPPTLLSLAIAFIYSLTGTSLWAMRLPSALLAALSVTLVYGMGRELFPTRLPAIFAAGVYLTLLPIVQAGRLATLDSAILCFWTLTIYCLLRSRRDLRWAVGIGMVLGLICLTKVEFGLLLGAIALVFLLWDTPRLLASGYLWMGFLLGIFPLAFWERLPILYSYQTLVNSGIFPQFWQPAGQESSLPWYYLLEMGKYTWPWAVFLPHGCQLIWENRQFSWAKLAIAWTIIYLCVLSLLPTKLSSHLLPIYPALGLIVGAQLAEAWDWSLSRPYPRTWILGLGWLGLTGLFGSLYFGSLATPIDWYWQIVLASAAFTCLIATMLLIQRDKQFILILLWGSYISLLLFIASVH